MYSSCWVDVELRYDIILVRLVILFYFKPYLYDRYCQQFVSCNVCIVVII